MEEEAEIECPFCGELIYVLIDMSVSEQTLIEDCSVCCRPIQLQVSCLDGTMAAISVDRSH